MPPVTTIGTPLIQLDTVDSSNNYAMAQIQAHLAEHGTTYLAKHQTAGRGQRGKAWSALPGQNIAMSTVVTPYAIPIHKQFTLSIAVALACFDLFNSLSLHYTSIKWPNDIYWKDRKAGGILIENILQGNEWRYSIIGIGMNINQTNFSPELLNPVSAKQITGKDFDILKLANQLCAYLQNRWEQLIGGNEIQLLEAYNTHLYKRNEIVTFKKENALIEARVIEVTMDGSLIVDMGKPTVIPYGSVEWMIS